MESTKIPWVVVLAAGEGSRVKSMTYDRRGRQAPKQYSLIDDRSTLLGATLDRARRIAPPEHIVPIVATQHRRWWKPELAGIPAGNIIVQPSNRGTAAGILLPFLWISRQDHDATVVILPSDHYVRSEDVLEESIRRAMAAVDSKYRGVVLLGIKPHGPETGYGWIVPCEHAQECPYRVSSFSEKPDTATSVCLLCQGAFLNSFILVASCRSLRQLFQDELPQLWQAFEPSLGDGPWEESHVASLYQSIATQDFSKDVLERSSANLWVQPVPECGWDDLGTPERLTKHLMRHAWSALSSREVWRYGRLSWSGRRSVIWRPVAE